MIKSCSSFLLFFFFHTLQSQGIALFTVQDFDLKGKVKSCLVITDYGKERFEFNEAGFLTLVVTQYSDADQDLMYYQYQGGELVEKRMESYRDNVLDAAVSMANFYTIDTVPERNILEKIVSYDKTFFEQREYQFDAADRLIKITFSREEGIDETTLTYTSYKGEHTKSIFRDGVLIKSIRTSKRKHPKGISDCVLTKTYIEGTPDKATEEVYDATGKLLVKTFFLYREAEQGFELGEKKYYQYDSQGVLQNVVTKTANTRSVETYSFQFDNHREKNWIKQIITPANRYITRRITYYPEE